MTQKVIWDYEGAMTEAERASLAILLAELRTLERAIVRNRRLGNRIIRQATDRAKATDRQITPSTILPPEIKGLWR